MNQTVADLLKGIAAGLLAGLSAGIADQLSGGAVRHSVLIGTAGAIPTLLGILGYGQVQVARARTAAANAAAVK